ncbi:hypothetical protein SKAU_G00201780 [Synaphobranchus kaupii]|uniref:Uncharacterized protein n=1 Tax=Synaphobranchus kaupii TaxID=118154 RepID=A0A9Q1IXD6_SYNKA|nr:hypothetical protein SKAU_G00201780 [Synaphobranchus kaupii]
MRSQSLVSGGVLSANECGGRRGRRAAESRAPPSRTGAKASAWKTDISAPVSAAPPAERPIGAPNGSPIVPPYRSAFSSKHQDQGNRGGRWGVQGN